MGINLTDVNILGQLGHSDALKSFAANMNKDTSSANMGDLRRSQLFYCIVRSPTISL